MISASTVSFQPAGLSISTRTAEEKLRELPTLADYNGYGDGVAHTVTDWISAGLYANLAAVQVDYPHVTATTNCANWAALLKLIAFVQANSLGYAKLGAGVFVFTQTVQPTGQGIAIVGVENPNITTGSIRTACTWRWLGGALEMIRTTTSGWTFHGFGIENGTNATRFLHMASGSQRNHWDKVYASAADGVTRKHFSDQLIFSDGDRLGYGSVTRCILNSVAPILFDVDNAGTGNSITTFHMNDNQFAASTQDCKVLRINGETIEVLGQNRNTVIMDGYECQLLDTTTSAAPSAINTYQADSNEFDIDSGFPVNAAWRFMKLKNVTNATITNNQLYGGGNLTAAFDLIGTHVISQSGNYYYSLNGYLYNPDSASTIAHGHNIRNRGNTNGDYPPSWTGNILEPTVTGATVLDLSNVPGQHKFSCLYPSGMGSYEIRALWTKPYWVGIGTLLTVAVVNNSGATIHAGSFQPAGFVVAAANIAPANGKQRLYTFYWNGAKWIELYRSAADMDFA